jgi:hypothetical protein
VLHRRHAVVSIALASRPAIRGFPVKVLAGALLALLAGAVLAGALFAGAVLDVAPAGAATELPPATTRRAVERLVHSTYPDLTFGNVACPSGVARRPGSTFSCTVQLPGAFLVVDGRITRSSGAVTLIAAQAVLPKASLEQFVTSNTSLPATVDCGPAPFQVARPGQALPCAVALADGTTRTAQLTVADTAGTVTITGVS